MCWGHDYESLSSLIRAVHFVDFTSGLCAINNTHHFGTIPEIFQTQLPLSLSPSCRTPETNQNVCSSKKLIYLDFYFVPTLSEPGFAIFGLIGATQGGSKPKILNQG